MSQYYRQLSFERPDEGTVNFLVDTRSGFNDSTTYEMLQRYFDVDYLKENATDIRWCGGRGQTMLFTLDFKFISAIYGPKRDFVLEVARAQAGQASQTAAVSQTVSNRIQGAEVRPSYALCWRSYRRGGLVGRVLKQGFCRFARRALRARDEFELTARLYRMGLPVPRPLIARENVGILFVTNDIVMEQIPDAENLAEILARNGSLTEDELKLIGATLERFFKAGVYHSDLNIRNILLSTAPDTPTAAGASAAVAPVSIQSGTDDERCCYLIDFDKCSCEDSLSHQAKEAMIARLERSFLKEKGLAGYIYDVALFMGIIRAAAGLSPVSVHDDDEHAHIGR